MVAKRPSGSRQAIFPHLLMQTHDHANKTHYRCTGGVFEVLGNVDIECRGLGNNGTVNAYFANATNTHSHAFLAQRVRTFTHALH